MKGEALLAVKGDAVERAIPWTEIPEVERRNDAGKVVKFSLRAKDGAEAFEPAAVRSVSLIDPLTFHDDGSTHRSGEVGSGFEK